MKQQENVAVCGHHPSHHPTTLAMCTLKSKECCISSSLTSHILCDSKNNSKNNQMLTSHEVAFSDLNNPKKKTAREMVSIIRKGNMEELKILLRSKPDLNVFVNGQTALHYCLLLGRDVSWCKQLVLNGANPNLSNLDGWHPIHLAAYNGHHEILTYLIDCNNSRVI